jgi:hypothetical protein
MGFDAALEKHPKDRSAPLGEKAESPTVEVNVDGRKVQVRQQTVASGLGAGIRRRIERLLG